MFALMRTHMHTHDFPGVSISKKSPSGPIVVWFEDHVILAKINHVRTPGLKICMISFFFWEGGYRLNDCSSSRP